MADFKSMPTAGLAVIVVILALFILSLILLFTVYARYRRISRAVGGNLERDNSFLRFAVNQYAAAYKQHGQDVNTPAIISDAVGTKLGGPLFCERFLNNAVSLFVTLGLFGTFLGLSLSVSSLTELISYSNTEEWLSVLNSVGGGLMSALSGMGVAFYTSLVGVACSITLTILRSVFSPQTEREVMQTRLELWLDHTVAPTLPTEAPKDDPTLVHEMISGINAAADSMEQTLHAATADFKRAIDGSRAPIGEFQKTVDGFNEGVRDFSEFNYNLRGTVERLDVCVRDLTTALRDTARAIDRSGK